MNFVEKEFADCEQEVIAERIDDITLYIEKNLKEIHHEMSKHLWGNWKDKNFEDFATFIEDTSKQMIHDLKDTKEVVESDLKAKEVSKNKAKSEELQFDL